MQNILLGIAIVMLLLLATCEALYGIPVAWWLYVIAVVAFAVGVLSAGPNRRMTRRICLLALVIAGVVLLYSVDWSTRKPFLRDLARVQIGMKEDEARHVMASYMEGTGLVDPPGMTSSSVTDLGSGSQYATTPSSTGEVRLHDTLVFRHSNEPAFNADWGIVRFAEGKVTNVEFSAD